MKFTPIFGAGSPDPPGSEPLVRGANSDWSGDPAWISAAHPRTGNLGFTFPYTNDMLIRLEMMRAVALPAGAQARLVYESFEDIEAGFDHAYVDVSADGAPFRPIFNATGCFAGRRLIDLSGLAGRSVRARFRFASDQSIAGPTYVGWYIGDMAIEVGQGQRPWSELRPKLRRRRKLPGHPAPQAFFRTTPNPAAAGQPVRFDASACIDYDRRPVESCFWSFGDGVTAISTQPSMEHVYTKPGIYRAALVVSDLEGHTDSVDHLVLVSQPPKPIEPSLTLTAGGWIVVGGDKADLGLHATRSAAGPPGGSLEYHDKAGRIMVRSEDVSRLEVAGRRATLTGHCSINKVQGYGFELEVADNGEQEINDFFHIRLTNGYDAGGAIGGGVLRIQT